MIDTALVRNLLDKLYESKTALLQLGVLRSERFTGELGEWLAETAYKGKRAKGTTQKGWDIEAVESGVRSLIQVKTHAKGKRNIARWTEVRPECLELFDRLVIIVLSDEYYIREWFDIPKQALRRALVQSGKSWVVNWDKVKDCAIDWKELPGSEPILHFDINDK